MTSETFISDVYSFDFADEKDLVEACIAGHDEGWKALLARYGRLIYTIPLRFGFSEQAAEEVFQETCLIMFEKLSELQDYYSLAAWIVTITRRRCIQRHRDSIRATRIHHEITNPIQQYAPDAELIAHEQQELVHLAFQRLDTRCQDLLRYLFFDESEPSYAELAQLLAIPRGSIGPMRGRCLAKLQHELQLLTNEEKVLV